MVTEQKRCHPKKPGLNRRKRKNGKVFEQAHGEKTVGLFLFPYKFSGGERKMIFRDDRHGALFEKEIRHHKGYSKKFTVALFLLTADCER